MTAFLEWIRAGYHDRCGNPALQKECWKKLLAEYPPVLKPREERASTLISREAGDLGLSLLWIVQAALVGPIISEAGYATPGGTGGIGALAHSEKIDPVILDGDLTLSGSKNYITGGRTSDYIIVSARRPGEDRISAMVFIRADRLPEGSLSSLDLGSLRTTDHGKLVLKGFQAGKEDIVMDDGGAVRSAIRRWSIIERSLILESYLHYMYYLFKRTREAGAVPGLEAGDLELLISEQEKTADRQIESAANREWIEEAGTDFMKIISSANTIHEAAMKIKPLPEEMRYRLSDLSFLTKMRYH
ncbi:MAG: hypothetical protein MUD12_08180 [Spirochaetes bacterium]|jgi:hypothetical protein|nr:hypothetical protein [Spirochaetota bacterium]